MILFNAQKNKTLIRTEAMNWIEDRNSIEAWIGAGISAHAMAWVGDWDCARSWCGIKINSWEDAWARAWARII
jgi:hypothetical protein